MTATGRWWPAPLSRVVAALVALLCAALALGLASQHPNAAVPLTVFLLALAIWTAWRPDCIWFLLPALLPVFSGAVWTGWWLIDEFDLLVLTLLAAGYARWLFAPAGAVGVQQRPSGLGWWRSVPPQAALWALLALLLCIGLVRGLSAAEFDAGSAALPWGGFSDWLVRALYADYTSAWNVLRVNKSLLWLLLLVPLLQRSMAVDPMRSVRYVVHGTLAGLTLVCLLLVWERALYVGLFNFTHPHRTTAWFWEMRVGGGAIDAYLALTAPLAFWAVWLAPWGWRWFAAALLAMLTAYAVLTTYSRGLYLAVAASLVFMSVLAWRLGIHPASGGRGRARALFVLLCALLVETVLVLGAGSFMSARWSGTDGDAKQRLAHWNSGLSLLTSPQDLWLGLGAGRLPNQYSTRVPGGELAGQAHWRREAANRAYVQLSGPISRNDVAYDFALTQRVPLISGGTYRVRLRHRVPVPTPLLVSVCERHLIFDLNCQWRRVQLEPDQNRQSGLNQDWTEIELHGQVLAAPGGLRAWRQGMLALTVPLAGHGVRLDAVELLDPRGQQVLRNTDFSSGLSHWMRAAQGHFLPWHMDNLYLEVLIERGIVGILILGGFALWAAQSLRRGLIRRRPLALALAGSLFAMGTLGLVISVTEVPRVAFILLLLLWVSLAFEKPGARPVGGKLRREAVVCAAF